MYEIYLGNTLLPVAPSKITIKIKNRNTTFTLVNDSELSVLKTPGLTDIEFSVLLPNQHYHFAKYKNGYKTATYFLSLFERLKSERHYFDFTILRILDNSKKLDWDTNLSCSLESYSITESAEEGIDFKVDLKLKQFVPYGTKTLVIKKDSATADTSRPVNNSTSSGSSSSGKSYTIKQNDTLWDIARTKLGDGGRWSEIYKLNKKTLDDTAKIRGFPAESGSYWIFPGTVITLP